MVVENGSETAAFRSAEMQPEDVTTDDRSPTTHDDVADMDDGKAAATDDDTDSTKPQQDGSSARHWTLEMWHVATWWERAIAIMVIVPSVLMGVVLYMLIIMLASWDADAENGRSKNGRGRSRTTNNGLDLPSPTNIVSPPTLTTPGPRASSDRTIAVKVKERLIRAIVANPFMLAFCGVTVAIPLIGTFAALPRQDQQACAARQTDGGFNGNADLYGLGIRLGIYVQWIAATIAIQYVPSTRSFVVSSYLFYQFGMIIALCLLLAPGSCTFTAETRIVLQILWAGAAIVMVPTQVVGKRYNRDSKHFGIEILSSVMGFLVFLYTFWSTTRRFFGKEDFADTPDGTWVFWFTPVDPAKSKSNRSFEAVWVGYYTSELIGVFQYKDNMYRFSGLVDWNWQASSTFATGSLTIVLKMMLTVYIVFTTVLGNIVGLEKNKQEEADWGPVAAVIRFLLRLSQSWIIDRFWMFRHIIIVLWSFLAVEYMIQDNEIEDVHSLNSTGQVLPLAISLATLAVVLYTWIKEFFARGQVPTRESSPRILEQAVGFPTASGRWI